MRNLVDLNVLDSNSGAGSSDRGKNAVLLNVNDGGTSGVNSGTALGGLSTGEDNSAKVGKGDQGAALLKVLNDPFCVVLAKLVGFTREFVGNGSARADVLNNSSSGRGAGGSHSDFDNISSRDGDAREVVGVVRVPLVPSIVADGAALNTKVDSSLENGGIAGVSVQTYPGRSAVLSTTAATTGNLRGGNSELSGDGAVAGSDEDSTGPVGAVLDVLVAGDVQLFHAEGVGDVSWV